MSSFVLAWVLAFGAPQAADADADATASSEAAPTSQKKRKRNKKKKKKKRDPNDPHRLEPGALPAVSYDIDLGLGFGALVTLAKFHPDFQPYRWRLEILASARAKNTPGVGIRIPFHDDYIKADFPGLWNGRLRINATARFRRYTNYGWHGIGNASAYLEPWTDVDPEDDPETYSILRRYHQYDRIFPELIFNGRIILWDDSKIGNDRVHPCGPKHPDRCPPVAYNFSDKPPVGHKRRLELLVGTALSYNWINPYANSKLAEDIELAASDTADGETLDALLHGTNNHALWRLNLGLLYDTRDHEFMTTRGSFSEASISFSPGVDEGLLFARLHLQTSVFAPLYGDYLVFGMRGALDFLLGKPPLYELGQFGVLTPTDGPGGSWSIRGVPRQRYFGKQKAILNMELRSLFVRFDIASQRFGIGALAFVDAGRLWTDYRRPVILGGEDVDGPFEDIKVGVGGGLRLHWGETLVVRVDPAWSPTDQNFGFYIDIAQMF